MEQNKKQTLKELLDENGYGCGDDHSFMLRTGSMEMEVSRRYIESTPWKYLLDMNVYCVIPACNMYGIETVKIVLED